MGHCGSRRCRMGTRATCGDCIFLFFVGITGKAMGWQQECPICLEDLHCFRDGTPDAQWCANGHTVCHTCARSLVRPSMKQYASDPGLAIECPLCRSCTQLNAMAMLALLKGGYRHGAQCFANVLYEHMWSVHSAPPRRSRRRRRRTPYTPPRSPPPEMW